MKRILKKSAKNFKFRVIFGAPDIELSEKRLSHDDDTTAGFYISFIEFQEATFRLKRESDICQHCQSIVAQYKTHCM